MRHWRLPVRPRNIAAGAVAVAILGFGVGAALTLTGALGTDEESSREHRRVTTTTTTTPTPALSWCRSPLTDTDPLRLWIGGDSLAGSLGPSLGAMTGATGIVQPIYDSRVSSGLANPSFFDWAKHATGEMTRLDPEVVVFIIGTNDWNSVSSSDASKAAYQQLVEEMIGILGGEQRHVYWVSAPTLEDKRKNEGVRLVNTAAREVVERNSNATFVDAYTLFADSEGRYTSTRPGTTGTPVRVRSSDGIHFTPEGGDLLGNTVLALLETACRLNAQSVPGSPKPVLKTAGATEIPGTNRGSGSTTTFAPDPTTTTTMPATTSSSTTSSSTTSSSTP